MHIRRIKGKDYVYSSKRIKGKVKSIYIGKYCTPKKKKK